MLEFKDWLCALEYRPHIWLGVSVENQEQADKRIPLLLQTPAAVRFISVEPLLGPVDLRAVGAYEIHGGPYRPGVIGRYGIDVLHRKAAHVDWVIVGGESGGPPERALVERDAFGLGKAWTPRPGKLEWVCSLRDQCVAAGVPFFFKQWGGPTPKSGGRMLDGREWSEYPA